MYPYYRESVDNVVLGYDDILAVYEQYGNFIKYTKLSFFKRLISLIILLIFHAFLVSKSFEEYDLETTTDLERSSNETTTEKVFRAENTTIIEDNDDFYDYFNSDYEYKDKNNSTSNGSYHNHNNLTGE